MHKGHKIRMNTVHLCFKTAIAYLGFIQIYNWNVRNHECRLSSLWSANALIHRESTVLETWYCSCGSVVEHCVSSAKVVGSIPREHIYWQYKGITWMHCKSLWIKASAKCINVYYEINTIKKTTLSRQEWVFCSDWSRVLWSVQKRASLERVCGNRPPQISVSPWSTCHVLFDLLPSTW